MYTILKHLRNYLVYISQVLKYLLIKYNIFEIKNNFTDELLSKTINSNTFSSYITKTIKNNYL